MAVTVDEGIRNSPSSAALEGLFELGRRAREAEDAAELGFVLVNDSRALCDYRQASLWFSDGGVRALSGVVQPEANAPYVQWLDHVISHHLAAAKAPVALSAEGLPADLASEWGEWLPSFALWVPVSHAPAKSDDGVWGGVLFARDVPWKEAEVVLLSEWMSIWAHAWHAVSNPTRWGLRSQLARLWGGFRSSNGKPLWRQARVQWTIVALALMAAPIRLSVLAPAELVPSSPAVIRAPIDGVIGSILIKPNDTVGAGQALLTFDEAPLTTRLEVARQALVTAEAEYRQAAQLAVTDTRQKAQLAILAGKIEERRAEAAYLQGQLERSRVTSPQEGTALFDDPSEWIGKPVATGERIMRIASPGDIEIEAWLNVGDAIPIQKDAAVTFYLNASPLDSLTAEVRYVTHDALQRPDGSYAYRVRARLSGATEHRVGLKGTAKLSGDRVPLIYWVLRRPLAAVRQMTGW
ncbi:MAG: secretion protein HylD [Betaproteobacteria bacterium HGW-Betaproteobacteria-13]|jgi:hypothetical protein|nr:MAG: secretion protein HylD [Betaproteobacteria bacterium HGW-Betaproteobacteria-21]PKO82063.1 MAG: secretion protein HylD [Betaproteobacteria bacterium HGW-Betaproteobacteria-13]